MINYREQSIHRAPSREMCYLYTPLRTCIIAARYSPGFHAYKSYVGGGPCSIVNGHGGVESYFESPGCSKRHCATGSVDGERLESTFLAVSSQTPERDINRRV